jgi:competence protein ComEC
MTGPRYQPLVIVAAAVCAGIGLDRFTAPPVAFWWLAAVTAWFAWLILWRRGQTCLASAAILLSALACGAAWHHSRWCLFADNDLGFCAQADEQPVCIEAVALTGLRHRASPPYSPLRIAPAGDSATMDVNVVGARDGSEWRSASGHARLTIHGDPPKVHAGDRLMVFCRLVSPLVAHNPGEFDRALFARGDRRRAILEAMHSDGVSVSQPGGFFCPRRWLENIRTAGLDVLGQSLDPKRAALASAVLLGAREEIDETEMALFVQTSAVHVVVIAGLHIGIFAGLLFLLMRLVMVPRRVSAVLVAGAIVFYTLLIDAHPPAVRAMVLVLAICAGELLNRRRPAMNALGAAAVVVLVINPVELFRTGAQLSFLYVAGFSWFSSRWFGRKNIDPLSRLVEASYSWPVRILRTTGRLFWQMTLLTGLLWLVTLPLVSSRFHILSPVGVLLNPLLWMPLVASLWSGFGVLAIGSIWRPLALPLAWFCNASLGLLQWLVETAHRLPASHFWVPGPSTWWLIGFYAAIGLGIAFPRLRPRPRWCAALVAVWIAAGLCTPLFRNRPAQLNCTFLSVDHGLATMIELPSREVMLYDAGRMASPEAGTEAIAGALWSRGLMHIDAVVLSHADSDHYNALPGLLERFSVGVVYVSPVMFEKEGAGLTALKESIEQAGVQVRELHAGDRLHGGDGCDLTVLHPPPRGILGTSNANSIVLTLEYQDRRILLTGDLEPPGLTDVVAEEPMPCDVLQAPHHGSRQSDPPKMAAWSTPHWLVISSGRKLVNPSSTIAVYRAVGAKPLQTCRSGAIRVHVDRAGIQIAPFLPGP